ncbi:MAG: cyclic nucleotide-binding domain-containing protein [Gallionella sp.]|nr:cyclic nucleotide-binding domain-containing protein [Gallionella sp.]
MTTIIDTLNTSAVTNKLSDTEISSIAEMFEAKGYKPGETVVLSESVTPDNLSILANGNIKIKIPCGIGESTVCMLSPGDLVDLNNLVPSATVNAKYYAVGNTTILSMDKSKFDGLVNSHPLMMCRVTCGMMHNLQSIVRRMNNQIADLRNYIYGTNNRS